MTRPLLERWTEKVNKTDSCWLWTGAKHDDGYGFIYLGGNPRKRAQAHRVAYELLVGPVPDGKYVDHLCRVRHCVNPAHLEPVTSRVNTLRGETRAALNAAQTHCNQGHPFNAENTYLHNRKRYCRPCMRRRNREWLARKNAA